MKLKLLRAAVLAVFCSTSGQCAVILALSFLGIGALSAPFAGCRGGAILQPVAEIKVKQLPKGELFWRVELPDAGKSVRRRISLRLVERRAT
jgi:hypothetical protein